tara:strand:+ start:1817 stop:1945 length:129 start_codon:yes stop_codon:yes gene_type:complete
MPIEEMEEEGFACLKWREGEPLLYQTWVDLAAGYLPLILFLV